MNENCEVNSKIQTAVEEKMIEASNPVSRSRSRDDSIDRKIQPEQIVEKDDIFGFPQQQGLNRHSSVVLSKTGKNYNPVNEFESLFSINEPKPTINPAVKRAQSVSNMSFENDERQENEEF